MKPPEDPEEVAALIKSHETWLAMGRAERRRRGIREPTSLTRRRLELLRELSASMPSREPSAAEAGIRDSHHRNG